MKNRIAELRKARQLTQQDLANLLGVTRQTIISLEGERYNPSITLAFKLARTFEQLKIYLFMRRLTKHERELS